MIDLEEAKDKVMMGVERKSMILTPKDKKVTAYHEAGHALVAYHTEGADPVHKIDIIPFSDDPGEFVTRALSPAKIKEVKVDEETGTATVVVPDYQLSLAIGKEGQNARLAARMTGWRVDIKSETEVADEVAYEQVDWAEGEWVVDEETGEQVWQPADGGAAMSIEEWSEAVDGTSVEGGDSDDEVEENPGTEQEVSEELLEETSGDSVGEASGDSVEEVNQEDLETN